MSYANFNNEVWLGHPLKDDIETSPRKLPGPLSDPDLLQGVIFIELLSMPATQPS